MLGKSEITQINERIILHRFVGTPFNEGNIICMVNNDGLVFVDAGRRADNAKKFRKQMEEKYSLPAKLLVLTHTHNDHFLGIGAFQDIPAVMAEKGKDEFFEMFEQGYDTEEGRQTRLDEITKRIQDGGHPLKPGWLEDFVPNEVKSRWFQPQILVRDKLTICDQQSEHEIDIVACGGHSPCSVYVYDRSSKTLITGDNLNSEHADNSGCMLFRAYLGLDLMKEWLNMDVEKYVPGHGRVVDKPYLRKSLDYFINLKKILENLKEKKVSIEEVSQHPDIPPFYEENIPDFMNLVVRNWYLEMNNLTLS